VHSFFLDEQREKTSQAFRDALADQYKSSNSFKKKRRLQDAPPHQLHKQLSAPMLSSTAIRDSNLDLSQHSHTSNISSQSSSVYSSASYNTSGTENNQMYGRPDPSMDMLLGELDNALSLNFNGQDGLMERQPKKQRSKRNLFQSTRTVSQRSATSVIDSEVQIVDSTGRPEVPSWFNRSCPDFSYGQNKSLAPSSGMGMENGPMSSMLNQVQEIMEEEDEEFEAEQFSVPNMYDDWHHSTPNLFGNNDNTMNFMESNSASPPDSSGPRKFKTRPNLLQLSPKKRSQSVRHLNMGGTNSFSVYHSPEKGSHRRLNHEDIVLSPIGDGNTDELFDKLQQIQEFSENNDGDFAETIRVPF